MTIHMGISVRGLLKKSPSNMKKDIRWISKDDGSHFRNVEEYKNHLLDELSLGHEVLPMGECQNWDYKTGCRGHEDTNNQDGSRKDV